LGARVHERSTIAFRFSLASLLGLLLIAAPTAGADPPPRLIVLVLDAVPYGLMAAVTDPGRGEERLFRKFSSPVPLVSTFPSTTSIALSGLFEPFGLEKSAGYEVRFFDRSRCRIRGGLWGYHKGHFAWRRFFDWRLKGLVRKAIAYGSSRRSSRAEVRKSLDAFLQSDRRFFFAYVNSTDATGHLFGPEAMRDLLLTLDNTLGELERRFPDRPFHSVLLSDHGMAGDTPLRNVRRGVERALEGAGLRISDRMKKPSDVVLVPYGLISSFVIFTAAGKEERVAQSLSRVEGVDLCVLPEGEGWTVVGATGRALIGRRVQRGADLWSYTPIDGDPLGYGVHVEELRRQAGDPGEQWFPDEAWFAATLDSDYPDALHRLAGGFDLVENPASVVCSTSPGFLFGSGLTDFGARLSFGPLRWTHGALRREDSLGFLMSDLPGWSPPAMTRIERALSFLQELPGFSADVLRKKCPGVGEGDAAFVACGF